MQSFYFVAAGLSGEEFTSLRTRCSITQHLWEQNSHWMRRVEPRLAHILRSQTKFGPQQRYEQDKRGEIVFGTIRVDDAWMAL